MLVDAHCHLYELSLDLIEKYKGKIFIVAVSDDLKSSLKTLEIGRRFDYVLPCVGIHPWEVKYVSLEEVEKVVSLVEEHRLDWLGEVGLDKRFVPETFRKQLEVFKKFLEVGRERKMVLNIHAAGAWKEVFELLVKYDIGRAIFHWYTGPLNLLKEITEAGFFITVNPAVRIQKKLRRIIEATPLKYLLSESDGPYKYRGMLLMPELVRDVIKYIAEIKEMEETSVKKILWSNFNRLRGC